MLQLELMIQGLCRNDWIRRKKTKNTKSEPQVSSILGFHNDQRVEFAGVYCTLDGRLSILISLRITDRGYSGLESFKQRFWDWS